jgi:hypothetical protein
MDHCMARSFHEPNNQCKQKQRRENDCRVSTPRRQASPGENGEGHEPDYDEQDHNLGALLLFVRRIFGLHRNIASVPQQVLDQLCLWS